MANLEGVEVAVEEVLEVVEEEWCLSCCPFEQVRQVATLGKVLLRDEASWAEEPPNNFQGVERVVGRAEWLLKVSYHHVDLPVIVTDIHQS